jgi:hypothetical protein
MIKVVNLMPLYVDSNQLEFNTWEEALPYIDFSQQVKVRKSIFERDWVFVWVYHE